jgi:hypothetical protein
MPRSAATIFGLVLVACSIGFNLWRYPIVWRMADPIVAPAAMSAAPKATPAAGESSHPSAATSAVQPIKSPPAPPERATPPLVPATQSEPTPVRGATNDVTPPGSERGLTVSTGVTSEKSLPIPQAPPLQWGGVSRQQGSIGSCNNLERPLAPVPGMATVAKPTGTAEPADAVRRLPPVDPNMRTMAGTFASGSSGGAIPIYPSTGIE